MGISNSWSLIKLYYYYQENIRCPMVKNIGTCSADRLIWNCSNYHRVTINIISCLVWLPIFWPYYISSYKSIEILSGDNNEKAVETWESLDFSPPKGVPKASQACWELSVIRVGTGTGTHPSAIKKVIFVSMMFVSKLSLCLPMEGHVKSSSLHHRTACKRKQLAIKIITIGFPSYLTMFQSQNLIDAGIWELQV